MIQGGSEENEKQKVLTIETGREWKNDRESQG